MEKLFEIQRILLEQFEEQPFYSRKIFDLLRAKRPVTGIVGARGVGKTTFLLQHVLNSEAKKRKALYVSADNLFFLTHRLIDLADYLYKQTDVCLLCIDEIHKYPNWRLELKNICDTYPSLQIFFSGSSMTDLVHGKYDLSRRVSLYTLHGFSFREYLEYHLGVQIPVLSFEEILSSHLEIAQNLPVKQILKHFQEYLKIGYYPFFQGFVQEKDKFQALDNAVQMTIYEDIGTFHTLKTPSLSVIEQLYKFVLNSSPGEINASKLSKNLQKDFDTVSTYLTYLEQAGLIRFIYSHNTGASHIRNPVKMYPENTNLIHAAYLPLARDQEIGKIRETFFVNQMQNQKIPIFYSLKGDFWVQGCLFEIGGKNKGTKQLQGESNAYIIADDVASGAINKIPLYLFGFSY